VQARSGTHLFPASLVDSQFATLERPADEQGVLQLDAALAPEELARAAAEWLTGRNDDDNFERRHRHEVLGKAS
jgi:gluconokinase